MFERLRAKLLEESPEEARYLVKPSDARSAEFAKIDKDGFAAGALRALTQLGLMPHQQNELPDCSPIEPSPLNQEQPQSSEHSF